MLLGNTGRKIKNLLAAFNQAFSAYKLKVGFLIFLGFTGGALEGIGINAVIPLFSFMLEGQGKPRDLISRAIESFFGFLNIPYSIKFLLIFITVLFILKAVAAFFTYYLTDKIRENYIRDQRNKLFKLTLKANWLYLSKQKLGYLEKVLINDINSGASLLSYFTSLSIIMVNLTIYILIAFNISYQITLITVALGLIIFLVFKPFIYKIRVLAYQSSDITKQEAHYINENMVGIKTVKAMTLEEKVAQKGREFFEKLKNIQMKLSLYSNFTNAATQPISVMVILTLFAFSYKTQNFNFASFAVIIYAINRIFSFVQSIQSQFSSISGLYPFLKSELNYENAALQNLEKDEGDLELRFKDKISFSNVSFTYNSTESILQNVSFEIPKGRIVGIIGPSGSGKTTVVDLLLRLIKPSSGKILLDNNNIEDIKLKDWRKRVGYVPQDIFLINDTIANNIRFYDDDITEKDIIEAAKMANIYDFVQSKPAGFNTLVGERGTELSGGQRQRIVLARVLARQPDILILDEATSALDNESEAAIQQALENLRRQITIVIIAHRPTTVMNADNLIVLKNGRIIETGSPKELLNKNNTYFSRISRH